MSSVLQGGFLNRSSSSNSRKCLVCEKGGPPALSCDSCQSHVCKSCLLSRKSDGRSIRECETCQSNVCGACRHVCHDPDCQALHCSTCSTMEACVSCQGMFCTEDPNDEMECAARCNCDNVICDGCQDGCSLCSAVLCESCKQGCSKCDDKFCSACNNFLVKCEYCVKEYCLICCAQKTTCIGCGKKPSRSRLVEASARLKRVQQGMASGFDGANSALGVAPALSTPTEESKADIVEVEKKRAAELAAADAARREMAEALKPAVANSVEAAPAAAGAVERASSEPVADRASASQEQQRGSNMIPKKNKKKKKKKDSSTTTSGGAAAAPAAPPAAPPAPAAAPAPVPTKLPAHANPPVSPPAHEKAEVYMPSYDVALDDTMDHYVIKKWVLNVASRKTKATASQIRRYFKGRVDPDVIDSYLEAFNNNFRDTVIQCAEFLNIFVPPDEEEEEVTAVAAVEDVNDDLVTGAFAAKERSKNGGDFGFVEHPLELRANEAFHNDCKDLKLLQGILDEARGQPGLARTRKMVNKMVKRIKAAQEEQKKLRQEQTKEDSKKEISQQLHPAYASKQPAFNSYQPPNIASDKEPDAMVDVPPNVVGWVIGKAGARINEIQQRTNAAMWMDQNFPAGEMRKLHIHGNKAQVEAAIQEVEFLMNSAPVNNSRSGKGVEALPPGHPDIVPPPSSKGYANRMIECPHALVGYLIGKKGAMIKRIKCCSNANVEVYQQFPDGVPRKVFISGPPEAVEIAVCMVEDVLASGKAADSPALETATTASSTASVDDDCSTGAGPVLGFSTSYSQESTSPPDVMMHDFGDLGGLGNGAALQHSQQQQQQLGTRNAIDRLHQGLASAASRSSSFELAAASNVVGGGSAAVGSGILPLSMPPPAGGPHAGAHHEYLAQRGALLEHVRWQQHQQQQQRQMQHLQQHQHQQLMQRQRDYQQHQQYFQQQQQQQEQQNQQLQIQHQQRLQQEQQQREWERQQQRQRPAQPRSANGSTAPPPGFPAVATDNSPSQQAPASVGLRSSLSGNGVVSNAAGASAEAREGLAAAAENGKDKSPSQPFASVEELLVSVGFLSLLPNFLEQEFDVGAIALMTDKDFEEISVPKGPQLKIQRACREAGLGPKDDAAPVAAAVIASPPQATAATDGSSAKAPKAAEDDSSFCHICFERPIAVTFVRCGHQICCQKCGDEQVGRPCPICRKTIEHAVRFYT